MFAIMISLVLLMCIFNIMNLSSVLCVLMFEGMSVVVNVSAIEIVSVYVNHWNVGSVSLFNIMVRFSCNTHDNLFLWTPVIKLYLCTLSYY